MREKVRLQTTTMTKEAGGAWECFGDDEEDADDDDADDDDADDDVVITADTSAHFRLFTEQVWGTPTASSSSSTRAREEEMRSRIETLERELGKTTRETRV